MRTAYHRVTGLMLMLMLMLSSCDAADPCDKDQKHEQGVCSPVAVLQTDAAAAEGGAAPDGGAALQDATMSTPCQEERAAVFGKSCASDANCNCAAPYCALMPGQTTGLCSVYCRTSPDDCPDGYMCFDLAVFGVQGVKPFCIAK
jgi:hypothetical protein